MRLDLLLWLLLGQLALRFTTSQAVHRSTYDILSKRASDSDRAFLRAAELADDATSASNSHLFYPDTEVPLDVMRYLVEERHGVNHHLPMKTRDEMRDTAKAKMREMLSDDRTRVSGFSYHGPTYFLTPAVNYQESEFPRWNELLQAPEGLQERQMQPMFLAKVRRKAGSRHEFEYSVLSIRTTATIDDKSHFTQSFALRRRYLTSLDDFLDRLPHRS